MTPNSAMSDSTMEPAAAHVSREPVTLPADLGIEQAARLHALLSPHFEDAAPVTLAAGGVSRLHTAGLQVLAAFVSGRAAAGRATTLDNPSTELRSAAARLGLSRVLGLASA